MISMMVALLSVRLEMVIMSKARVRVELDRQLQAEKARNDALEARILALENN